LSQTSLFACGHLLRFFPHFIGQAQADESVFVLPNTRFAGLFLFRHFGFHVCIAVITQIILRAVVFACKPENKLLISFLQKVETVIDYWFPFVIIENVATSVL
jgi:hypothetical protein